MRNARGNPGGDGLALGDRGFGKVTERPSTKTPRLLSVSCYFRFWCSWTSKCGSKVEKYARHESLKNKLFKIWGLDALKTLKYHGFCLFLLRKKAAARGDASPSDLKRHYKKNNLSKCGASTPSKTLKIKKLCAFLLGKSSRRGRRIPQRPKDT